MKSFFFFTFFLLVMTSCKLYVIATIKESKNETEEDVKRYLKKKKILAYDAFYFFKDECFDELSVAKNSFYLYRIQNGNTESGLQCRIYDKLGNIVNGYTPCFGLFNQNDCLLKDSDVVPAKKSPYLNLALTLETDLKFWDITEIERRNILADTTRDYTIVALWNERFGYVTKDMLQQLSAFKKANTNKVRLFLVNTGRDINE